MKKTILIISALCFSVGLIAQKFETSTRVDLSKIPLDSSYLFIGDKLDSKSIYEHSENQIIEIIYDWNPQINQWDFDTKRQNNFSKITQHGKTVEERISSYLSDNKYVNSLKHIITYYPIQADLVASVIEYKWKTATNQWEPWSQNHYTYNQNGQLLTDSILYFDSSQKWIIHSKYEAIYNDNGQKIKENAYEWEDGSYFRPTIQVVNKYDGTHPQPIETIRFQKQGNDWKEDRKIIGTMSGDTLKTITYQIQDTEWLETTKTQYLHNYENSFNEIQLPHGFLSPRGESFDAYRFQLLKYSFQNFDGVKWASPYEIEYYYSNRIVSNQVEKAINKETLVYPNPAKNILNINANVTTIQLYDLLGKLILTKNLAEQHSVNISHLENGMYLYQLTMENKTEVGKILISH